MRSQRNAVIIIIEQHLHGNVSEGPADDVGDSHQPEEFLYQYIYNLRNSGAQDLADADFFCPAVNSDGCQSKDAHAGDDDSQR